MTFSPPPADVTTTDKHTLTPADSTSSGSSATGDTPPADTTIPPLPEPSSAALLEDRLKCTLYIGGLADEVTKDVIHAAFVGFGDIKLVEIPTEKQTGKHRGFAFIEFEEEVDASEAVFNMNMSELQGRTIKVNIAKFNNKLHIQQRAPGTSAAAWSDDFFYRKRLAEEGLRIADGLDDPVAPAEVPPPYA
eukprot:GHVS01088153.1.p1 GENE.GHVS01088153.1~~GHVS01088153.1.p1  ORF type:complete len:191 (+),score=55.48 GHVS01088153.1:109-681(+)